MPTTTALSHDEANNGDPVQVFLRMRPLIPEEKGHKLIEYETNKTKSKIKVKIPPPSLKQQQLISINPAFASAPPLQRRKEAWNLFGGFTRVIEDDCNNERVYQSTVQPLISRIASPKEEGQQRQSACVFTYGHTGSGKTHTLLGNGNQLGVYKYAAKDLLNQLQQAKTNGTEKCLMVRVTELYHDVIDLLTGEACSIRQGGQGVVHLRGPMVKDEQGRITQRPLGQLCTTPEQVIQCVDTACESRRVGTSTHHSQSSRSHLVLELEVVTPQLVDQRNLLLGQEAQLTRLKWLETERSLGRHVDRALPQWTLEYAKNPMKLREEIQQFDALVPKTKQAVRKIILEHRLGGTLVFCDLSGNEYARDSTESTKEELEEAAAINRSLLAVKAMLRCLATKKSSTSKPQAHHHVPYRESKLTMILRRHLDTRAVMLAHISPSQDSFRKTINTLNYSSLLTHTRPSGSTKKKKGR